MCAHKYANHKYAGVQYRNIYKRIHVLSCRAILLYDHYFIFMNPFHLSSLSPLESTTVGRNNTNVKVKRSFRIIKEKQINIIYSFLSCIS